MYVSYVLKEIAFGYEPLPACVQFVPFDLWEIDLAADPALAQMDAVVMCCQVRLLGEGFSTTRMRAGDGTLALSASFGALGMIEFDMGVQVFSRGEDTVTKRATYMGSLHVSLQEVHRGEADIDPALSVSTLFAPEAWLAVFPFGVSLQGVGGIEGCGAWLASLCMKLGTCERRLVLVIRTDVPFQGLSLAE